MIGNVRLAVCVLGLVSAVSVFGRATEKPVPQATSLGVPSRLLVVWTSGDREVALKMVFMYTLNAKKRGWWDEIRFLIWGPSSKLLAADQELQEGLAEMKKAGVELLACKACADLYEVSGDLEGLGVEVKYMGVPLTEMLKGDWKTITF